LLETVCEGGVECGKPVCEGGVECGSTVCEWVCGFKSRHRHLFFTTPRSDVMRLFHEFCLVQSFTHQFFTVISTISHYLHHIIHYSQHFTVF